MAKKLTKSKAREILHDKEVHGHPLTEKQRKFFGAIAGGAKPYAQAGLNLTALPINLAERLSELLSVPQKAATKLITGKYQTPSEAMGIKNKAGAIATDMILDPVNLLSGVGIGKTAKKALAFKPKPGMMYRGLGEEGFKDAVESGVFRPKQYGYAEGRSLAEKVTTPKQFGSTYYAPSSKFDVVKDYGGKYVAEVPFEGNEFARRYGRKDWSWSTGKQIPIDEGRILKKDWLRGYKEVKPSTKKKQDGGWLDKYDAPQAQNGIEGTMGGLTDIGFNYNGAWGGPSMQDGGNLIPPMAGANTSVPMAQLGDSVKPIPMQLAMGGSLPGAVGFMYARTQSPAPDNGPYAKKTKASAQDGKKVSYSQWKKQYNLKETPDYNLKRAWELGYTPDKTGHLPTVDNQTGQFLKAKGHPTLQLELDWYNSPEAADFRSKNAIDSSGKFFKYVPKGQNGQEMKYYQEGLDFKPKTISQNGSKTLPNVNLTLNQKEPVYVSDPNDPRLRAYQDSLTAYNVGKEVAQGIGRGYDKYYQENWNRSRNRNDYEKYFVKNYEAGKLKYPLGGNDRIFGSEASRKLNEKDIKELAAYDKNFSKLLKLKVRPQSALYSAELPPIISYRKPTQPVVLEEEPRFEKPIPIPRDTRDLGYTLPTPGQFTAPELYKYNPDTPTKYTFTSPTGKYNEQKTMYFPSKSALKSFVGGVRGATYQEGADYASATGTLQDGGYIPVDPMGYWNPENVGGPVIIPSTDITMQGVDQPLIGISDTGDVQYMQPGEDYSFDGEYVTEYPVAKGGISVNDADAQPLKKLDQLLNFTNYNKPTKGGWLDKYQ